MNPLFSKLFRQHRYLTNRLNEQLRSHNLYHSQWTILYCLMQNGAMTLSEISRYMAVEAPTVTRTVRRLEELGWLVCVPGQDRREKIAHLTQQAEQKLPAVSESVLQFEANMIGSLTSEEQQQFIALLEKMKG